MQLEPVHEHMLSCWQSALDETPEQPTLHEPLFASHMQSLRLSHVVWSRAPHWLAHLVVPLSTVQLLSAVQEAVLPDSVTQSGPQVAVAASHVQSGSESQVEATEVRRAHLRRQVPEVHVQPVEAAHSAAEPRSVPQAATQPPVIESHMQSASALQVAELP